MFTLIPDLQTNSVLLNWADFVAQSSESVSNLDLDSSKTWFNQHHNHPNDPNSGFAAIFNPSNSPKPSITSSIQISDDDAVLPTVVSNPKIVETVSEA